MRWAFDRAIAVVAFAATMLRAPDVLGAGDDDPSRGRIEGDVSLVAGVGAAIVPGGARADAELRLRYLETVGIFATYEDGPLVHSGAEPIRALSAGLEVRPFFLFRWLKGYETPHARLDLALDSIGLELGAAFLQPSGASFASLPALEAGVGIELPIVADASGPWVGLHGGVRWSDDALSSGQVRGPDDRSAYLDITLAWHQAFMAHVVDVGDRASY
jgi:hypothetical protein